MPDMLVRLYDLPALGAPPPNIEVRRVLAPEVAVVAAWVQRQFGGGWHAEVAVACAQLPPACFVAVRESAIPAERALLGFAAYDAVKRGFFGPMGVDAAMRGTGLGRALLLACLHDMWARGYGYAIIGAVGPTDFYAKACGATVIEGSTPGVYRNLLPRP